MTNIIDRNDPLTVTSGGEHRGGCHCGNLRVVLRLTQPPEMMRVRACLCSFCRRHATRTVSDPAGTAEISAADPSLVERYRFGGKTADFLLCRRCGVYIGAICETASGTRSVTNTNCLDSRAAFSRPAAPTDHDGETTEARLARREVNWTPALVRIAN